MADAPDGITEMQTDRSAIRTWRRHPTSDRSKTTTQKSLPDDDFHIVLRIANITIFNLILHQGAASGKQYASPTCWISLAAASQRNSNKATGRRKS
jgi:hypothetical protein